MNGQESTSNISNNGTIHIANFCLSSIDCTFFFFVVFIPHLIHFCFVFFFSAAIYLCNPDDKKLGGVLKKMGFTEMKGMEEVNIFKDDGTVIHIKQTKINNITIIPHLSSFSLIIISSLL